MGKYSTKTKDEDGKDAWLSSDGRLFQTRAGAWKHSKSLDEPVEEAAPHVEPVEVMDDEPDPLSWAQVDFSGDTEDATETIPTVFKRITPAHSGEKKTKRELEAERKTNIAVLKIGYRTGDALMTRYKRGMMEDPKADPIKHTEQDYDWISGVSNAALEENGISIGAAIGTTQIAVIANGYWFGAPIGTTQIAVIANGYWFGAPIAKIHKESDKSPFKGRAGGAIGRFMERLPIIGKRIRARREVHIPIIEGGRQDE